MQVMVTGGAGFIGSALIRYLIRHQDCYVVNIDKLTYAGSLESVADVADSPRYAFEQIDIVDGEAVKRVFEQYRPDVVIHLAAESHNDRSIASSEIFINTNIVGTYTLLEAARQYWNDLGTEKKCGFRFYHVSTDEVFGSLDSEGAFTESSRYHPNSPYSASKASADHLARAWHRTYGLPVVISNCSNNYGPYQYPEKLIPLMVVNALQGKPLPVYGDGKQVRDWLYVDDHAEALWTVATKGSIGETYNIGGNNERSNLEVVEMICDILAEQMDKDSGTGSRFRALFEFVEDRMGHDQRYAIDAGKIRRELGWQARTDFEKGLRDTVQWYVDHRDWWQARLDPQAKKASM